MGAARRGLAVGFFDGVHLGHQAILRRASAVLTFRNHPLSLLAPERSPRLLMSAESRIAAIRGCGVEKVTALDFTPELAAMSAEDFINRHIACGEGRETVYCGENWRFGRGGAGDPSLLKSCGFNVEVVPYALHRGGRISSTRIRAAIEAGEIEDANLMLGRAWSVTGTVFKGKGLGSGMGYPTLNLRLDGVALRLMRGVYAVEVCGAVAAANYGVAPTFGDGAWSSPVLEVHFLDGLPEGAADASSLEVMLLGYIRPERKFGSKEALALQIASDCAEIRRRFIPLERQRQV